jgi:AcrR family transcriptional regulator
MVANLQEQGSVVTVRSGTGTRRSGRAAVQRILRSAHALLARSGPAQFSMRNVAARAGLHLANLQYYFPTRDALVDALLQDVGQRYRVAYARCLEQAGSDRMARFEAVLNFNLEDVGKRATRRYFIQLWALLDGLDGHSGRRLKEMYAMDIDQLSERIQELDTDASATEVRRRATLLAAMIEGLMVVQGAHSSDARETGKLREEARELGFAIALGSQSMGRNR